MSTDAEDDAVAITSLDEAIGLPCKDLGCKEHEEKIVHEDVDDSYPKGTAKGGMNEQSGSHRSHTHTPPKSKRKRLAAPLTRTSPQ